MSKRDLKKYVQSLNKIQLEEQVLELYEKFSAVKTYYDFAFNPKEDVLMKEAKIKISNEYFPVKTTGRGSRPKLRRSIAQKYIKHFMVLGVDSFVIADLMLYSIEIAQTFTSESNLKPESFYKSHLNSFEQAVSFLISEGILDEFKTRIIAISTESLNQNWQNKEAFQAILERFDY